MTMNFDQFSEAELIDLNRRIVERLRLMQQMRAHKAMMNFSVGERVWFRSAPDQIVRGTITRYNRKTVTILSDDSRQWNVSPWLVQKDAVDVNVQQSSNEESLNLEYR